MNLINRDLSKSFQVGKSGGSNVQPSDIKRARRGLVQVQSEPLVIWWVKLLRQEYSADLSSRPKSYRRSRWGQPISKQVSPISPFSAMHKEGRLLTPSSGPFPLALLVPLVFSGLVTSLNMVALAEPALPSVRHHSGSANEIPSAERFSMMKDFVGRHNQYLDLSKLSEFKWTDETRVTSRAFNQKRHLNRVFADSHSGSVAQPQAVQLEVHRQKKNDAELTGFEESVKRESGTGSAAGFHSNSESGFTRQWKEQTTVDALLDFPTEAN